MTLDAVPTRAIGGHGMTGPALAMGCMGLSAYYGHDTAGADADAVIGAAIEVGMTLLDTSDSYAAGRNEEAVGKAVRGRRDQVQISTKFGRGHHDRATSDAAVGRPEHVREACEASLRRLGVDHVDLYIYHRVDPTTPVEETLGAMADLQREGKVRYLGLSEVGAPTLRRASTVCPVTVVQSEYSLLSRDPEHVVWHQLSRSGTTLMAYSPLARGVLAGLTTTAEELPHDDWRRSSPRFAAANMAANAALVRSLAELARDHRLTLPQLALAWLVGRGALPVQGATTPAQVRENAAAATTVLEPAVAAQVERLAPPGAAAGERASAAYLAHVEGA